MLARKRHVTSPLRHSTSRFRFCLSASHDWLRHARNQSSDETRGRNSPIARLRGRSLRPKRLSLSCREQRQTYDERTDLNEARRIQIRDARACLEATHIDRVTWNLPIIEIVTACVICVALIDQRITSVGACFFVIVTFDVTPECNGPTFAKRMYLLPGFGSGLLLCWDDRWRHRRSK